MYIQVMKKSQLKRSKNSALRVCFYNNQYNNVLQYSEKMLFFLCRGRGTEGGASKGKGRTGSDIVFVT